MIWLVLGVLLWAITHSLKRIAPGLRAGMGDAGKAVVALASLASIALMVIGFRAAPETQLWTLGSWAVYLNNLLMLVAVAFLGAGNSKSRLRGKLRHPMLTGFLLWSVGHLLVNGDMASVVLFGGLGLWAMLAIALINRGEPATLQFGQGTLAGDIRLGIISAVLYAVIVGVHIWIGPSPFAV